MIGEELCAGTLRCMIKTASIVHKLIYEVHHITTICGPHIYPHVHHQLYSFMQAIQLATVLLRRLPILSITIFSSPQTSILFSTIKYPQVAT